MGIQNTLKLLSDVTVVVSTSIKIMHAFRSRRYIQVVMEASSLIPCIMPIFIDAKAAVHELEDLSAAESFELAAAAAQAVKSIAQSV